MSSEQLAAQRLAEAPVIEAEWAAMSYKDRASWWMSAKWYGYMTTEAYRRGDAPANANESCRYGEPGFFIATRVPYFEAQAAVSSIVAPTPTLPVVQEEAPAQPSTAVVEALTIPSKPTAESEVSSPAPIAAEIVPTITQSLPSEESTEQPAAKSTNETVRDAIVGSIDSTTTPLLATAIPSNALSTTNKKKKKNKHHACEGKTIQIRVGGGTQISSDNK